MNPARSTSSPHEGIRSFESVQGLSVLTVGAPLDRALAAMIMVHGRGASAEDILSLSLEFSDPAVAYLAPQAAGSAWYPLSFLSPIANNEPGISSGLAVLAGIAARVNDSGIPSERIILLGFSQGACLALEYAARNARRFGGVAGLSGGLIGPDGIPRNYAGSHDGTPVFLGCSVEDPHIPRHRVELTREVFRSLGADVTMRLYPEPGHMVNEDEVEFVQSMVRAVVGE